MTVERGFGSVVLVSVGVLIFVVALLALVSVLSGGSVGVPLISETVELRKASSPVDRAELISSLDDLVIEADVPAVSEQWDRMTGCLASSCPDEAFLDMILVTVSSFESEIPNSALLINVIATAKYWNDSEHLLEFSRALSVANEQVDLLGDKKAVKVWGQIVECDNVCADKFNLYFDLVSIVVK